MKAFPDLCRLSLRTCRSKKQERPEHRLCYHLASSCFALQDYDGQTRVTAKGIGHGLGMSQYTAEKMAEEGKTCEEILQYFFTDVSLEEVTDIVIEKNEKGE